MSADVPFLTPITRQEGWYLGEDKILQVIVYSVLPTVASPSGTRQNVSGWSFQWELRTAPSATGAALLTKTSAGGAITIADAANGVVNVAIDQADTKSLAPAEYHHTLTRVDSGHAGVVATGPAVLLQSDYHP